MRLEYSILPPCHYQVTTGRARTRNFNALAWDSRRAPRGAFMTRCPAGSVQPLPLSMTVPAWLLSSSRPASETPFSFLTRRMAGTALSDHHSFHPRFIISTLLEGSACAAPGFGCPSCYTPFLNHPGCWAETQEERESPQHVNRPAQPIAHSPSTSLLTLQSLQEGARRTFFMTSQSRNSVASFLQIETWKQKHDGSSGRSTTSHLL